MSRRQNTARKADTIKFVLLSFTLFLISDIFGRWFVSEDFDSTGLWRIIIWATCFMVGAAVFFGWRLLDGMAQKILALVLFQAAFVLLLIFCRFYRYGDCDLIGYKIIISIIPAVAVGIRTQFKSFIQWYGMKVKQLFGLLSVKDLRFLFSFILLAVIIILAFYGGYKIQGCMNGFGHDITQLIVEGEINHNKDHYEPVRQYDRIFNDLNDIQLTAAMKNGLRHPIETKDVEKNSRLRRIENCKYYKIDNLTHSMPYLVPKAAKLVEDIGRAFQDSLYNRGYNRNHRITITSVLRTDDLVNNLRKTNVNSSTNSCHCYGTTVDISYFSFETPTFGRTASIDKMRQVFMQVVYDLRNAERCYVKYEKQQTCLHITIR